MKKNKIEKKIVNATKWSSITEIAAKIVSPITNMVLARILAPEAFGVVATVTMITSFVDMFTDAGFQKYIVQHEFKDNKEKYQTANVAFITNFIVSLILWGAITLFSENIATLVGSPGLGLVITIACIQLPLTAFSSIQMALYRREFDFKTLFMVRMVSIFIPFFVTIPLALLGLGYWSLILGNICAQLSNAVLLTIKSKWKPGWFYKVSILKKMLSFSIWSLFEAIAIWLTTWIDTFIIGSLLSDYYLGLYKTSTTTVNSLMALITGAIIPVLFAALSRLQNDKEQFNQTFFNVQRIVSMFVIPLGIGVWLYSDVATQILLGSQWSMASQIIGIWALTSSLVIVLSHFCSEVYRAKGRPKLSLMSQLIHLLFLVPTCIISSKFGFWALIYARSLIRLQGIIVHIIIMKFAIGIPILKTFKNITPIVISAMVMGGSGYFLRKLEDSMTWIFLSIILCTLIYFGTLYLFPNMRCDMNKFRKLIPNRLNNSILTLGNFKNNN